MRKTHHVQRLKHILSNEGYDISDILKGYFKDDIMVIIDDYVYDASGVSQEDIKPLYRLLVKLALKAEDGGMRSTYEY